MMRIEKRLQRRVSLLFLIIIFILLGWFKWNSSQDQAEIEPIQQPRWILFHSTKCESCKKMEELSSKLKEEYKGKVEFVDVDIDKQYNEKIVSEFKITFIPTSEFEAEGVKRIERIGTIPENELREILDSLVKKNE